MSATPDNSFEQQLDEIVYEIFRSEEFINYIASLANTHEDYEVDDYYYPEDLSWPTITRVQVEEEEVGEEVEEEEEETVSLTAAKYTVEMDNKECSICLIDFEIDDSVVVLDCHHIFHQNCILEWVTRKKDCPNCREKIKS
jgi:hypothetical protein